MIVHYVLEAESHTKQCADYVLAMAMLGIVPIHVKYDEETRIIQWKLKTHKDLYDVLRKAAYMTPDL